MLCITEGYFNKSTQTSYRCFLITNTDIILCLREVKLLCCKCFFKYPSETVWNMLTVPLIRIFLF